MLLYIDIQMNEGINNINIVYSLILYKYERQIKINF